MYIGNFGYFNQDTKRQYAIGSPRGTKTRTGTVYIADYDGTENLNYLQELTPTGKDIIFKPLRSSFK